MESGSNFFELEIKGLAQRHIENQKEYITSHSIQEENLMLKQTLEKLQEKLLRAKVDQDSKNLR